ncbi:outer membrane beta-barrel protein [Dyella acidiphila]|uniref:Outer membrane beta-barrel protein n=1 Tax=Dyella acidiphila TaxID=2775866 RepID=A0ABR9G681_9GAMM|nr:outer membrane beta-barrel protein [Dyella acidiphila]MBE1159555.1 outer membrane beta-barrel protein [Dyella acidiphila]
MKKLLFVTAAAFTAFAAAGIAAADPVVGSNVDTNQLDNFFAAGNLGQTQYRTDITHPHSVFQNVRFGWRWNGIVGAEVGYAYLGRRKSTGPFSETSVNARAATLGLNAKYNVYDGFFVTAHGGYLRSQRTDTVTNYLTDGSSDHRSWNNGLYGGLGLGYDVTHNVSLALNYDNYRLQYNHPDDRFRDKVNVAAYSASIEYRF